MSHDEDRDAGGWKRGVVERMRDFSLLKTHKAVFRSTFSKNEKFVLLAIISHWSKRRPVPFVSVPRLAVLTSLSTASVKRAIANLEHTGVLAVFRRKNRSNWYDLSAVVAKARAQESPALKPKPGNSRDGRELVASGSGATPNQQGGLTVSPSAAQGELYAPPSAAQGEPRIDPLSLRDRTKEPHSSGSAGGERSSPESKRGSTERESEQKRLPKDNATVEVENHYLDLYRAHAKRAYYTDKPDGRSRAAFKDLHEKFGLAEAKLAISNTFVDEWTRKNRSLPWEILADASKRLLSDDVVDLDADAIEFKLRPSTDEELRLQAAVTGANLESIERVKGSGGGWLYKNPSWVFRQGFNPENSSWLQLPNDQNMWAAMQAADGVVTPRYRAMSTNMSKKEICRLLFLAGITPAIRRYQNFTLWQTKPARDEVLRWMAEWDQEAKAKSA